MRRSLIALALAAALPLPGVAAEVTVKPGETLSEIAERHGIPVRRLMTANGISDPDHVEVGQTLSIPAGSGGGVPGGRLTVQKGETLSAIAERHGISMSRLMKANGVSDPDHVEVGQSLTIPGGGTAASPTKKSFSYDRSASQHVIRPGESLSAIARGYDIPVSRLVAINAIDDPDQVKAGTRLRLRGQPAKPAAKPTTKPAAKPATPAATAAAKPKPTAKPAAKAAATPVAAATMTAKPDWRIYGPLQVDWANWQPMGGSLVAPTLTGNGNSLYLAINCSARKLNATTGDGQWQSWDDPREDFEQKLLTDLCTSRES